MLGFCLEVQALSTYGLNMFEVKEKAVTTGTRAGVKVPWQKKINGNAKMTEILQNIIC